MNCDLRNLRAAWNWALRFLDGFPELNPFAVDFMPEDHVQRYVPPLADFWAVLAQAESEQDKVMLLAYLYLAARRSELFRLRVEDVDFSRRLVSLGTRKRAGGGMAYDWVPIAEPLVAELEGQIARVPGPWVFPRPGTGQPYLTRNDWLRRLCDRAGVRRFGFHAIRHLAASLMADAAVPTVQIQRVLRHQRMTTTDVYVRSLGAGHDAVAVLPAPPARPERGRE